MKTITLTTAGNRHHQADLHAIEVGDDPLLFKLDNFKIFGSDMNRIGRSIYAEVFFTSCRTITCMKINGNIFPEDLSEVIKPLIDKAFDQSEEDHFPAQ